MKEKSIYLGVGFVIGLAVGLLSLSKISVTNVGNIDRIAITVNNNEKNSPTNNHE
ncbi:hypothetical protein [Bacillus sp. HMF5848]|uniref:hypothetical protein n=1 Tax=Bacillus sp. HMF5848 TaxID=2495421 RepID=UPI00163ADAF0|nr:hypothetical protein [Bacillus sp. HMF5848]